MNNISCPTCAAILTRLDVGLVWIRCPFCHGMIFRTSTGPKVLIAHESEEVCELIGVVLLEAGFAPLRAEGGDQAIEMLEAHRPQAAVLDVALEQVLAFQVIEHLRKRPHLQDVKVVLVASVYNKTAYKRKPKSLYGADDYVEQHHIPDYLPVKLGALLNLSPPPARVTTPKPTSRIREVERRCELVGAERVKAIAHNIVSDIALYQQAEIEQAMCTHNFSALDPALEEGRRLLAEMVPHGEVGGPDPILEAFKNLVEKMHRGR